MVVFGRPVSNWHAATLAIRHINSVLHALQHRAQEVEGKAYWAVQGKMAQLIRLCWQAYQIYRNG